jgi:hypothetical protein
MAEAALKRLRIRVRACGFSFELLDPETEVAGGAGVVLGRSASDVRSRLQTRLCPAEAVEFAKQVPVIARGRVERRLVRGRLLERCLLGLGRGQEEETAKLHPAPLSRDFGGSRELIVGLAWEHRES